MRQPIIESAPAPAGLPAYCPVAPPRRRRVKEPVFVMSKPRGGRNESGEKMLTVAQLFDASANDGSGAAVPMIRMRGRWLKRLGFAIGARIVVTEERGRIVLTLAVNEEQRQ